MRLREKKIKDMQRRSANADPNGYLIRTFNLVIENAYVTNSVHS